MTSSPTQALAHYVVDAKPADLPADVVKEATRTFVNWAGCAVGGSQHETRRHRHRGPEPLRRPRHRQHPRPRGENSTRCTLRCSTASARMCSISTTRICAPSSTRPARSPARCSPSPSTSRSAARISSMRSRSASRSNAASAMRCSPHITMSAGTSPAPPACSAPPPRSASCSASTRERMSWAFGLAASQPVGLREMFGTMTKSFHPGRAAQNGIDRGAARRRAAIPARTRRSRPSAAGPTSSAPRHDSDEITEGLGERYEILANTYKPFACGIVIHPAIDGCMQLRNAEHRSPPTIRKVDCACIRLVLELTGKTDAANRPRRQIQRLPRRGGGPHRRRWRRGAVHRPRGADPAIIALRRPHQGRDRPHDRTRRGAHHGDAAKTAASSSMHVPARHRQHRPADDRCRSRTQIPWPRRTPSSAWRATNSCSICAGASEAWTVSPRSPRPPAL